ncbi:hypothetical protein HY483_04165 [Candidatus Woesearchaeota archaeon]|nr:hypothetical protein [Candidatus Woesearchaeota archaeon]
MDELKSILDSANMVCKCWNINKPLSSNISNFKNGVEYLRFKIKKFIDSATVSERITFHRDTFILRQKTVFLVQHLDELLTEILLRIPLLEIHSHQGFVAAVDNTIYDFVTKILNNKKQISTFVEKQKPKSVETTINKFFHSITRFFFLDYKGWEL